jgi:adenylate cyclase
MADTTPPSDVQVTQLAIDESARAVVGAAPTLTVRDVLSRTGLDFIHIQYLYSALGTVVPDWDTPVFTEGDLRMLAGVTRLVDDGVLDADTWAALVRGISQSVERLVWWQFEVLVEHVARMEGMGDLAARLRVLSQIADLSDVLEAQMKHIWRHHLSSTIRWIGDKVTKEGSAMEPAPGVLPLPRAVGVADLVGYTEVSEGLDAQGLAALVQEFEAAAVDAVARWGGRVVKSMGDAVLYWAATPSDAAMIALGLAETIGRSTGTPPVRVGMAWGRVLGRFGDVFGPTVNLASRLAEIAEPGQVMIDEAAARALADDSRVDAQAMPPRGVAGIGIVRPYCLVRA